MDDSTTRDPLRGTGLPQPLRGTPQLPVDAQRMGLDGTTQAGQEIQFAASLRSDKAWHKIVAWCALIAILAGVLVSVVSLFTNGI